MVLGMTIAATSIAQPAPTVKSAATVSPVSVPVSEEPLPPVVPATALSPAQRPAVAPLVTYRDGQLTIIAENCNLGDILEEVHRLTGVQVDLPPAASQERMAARLGPGPTREVLTSLLSSTDFNYIMQAADDDPNQVQSVLLVPRSQGGIKPAAASAPSRTQHQNQRRTETASDSSDGPGPDATVSTASAGDNAPPADNQGPATPDAPTQAETTPTPAPTPATATVDAQSISAGDQMMQGLKRLYEQRRQMQEQQNQQRSGGTPQ
jgi:hypothetical protein